MKTVVKTQTVSLPSRCLIGDLRCEDGIPLKLLPGKYSFTRKKVNLGEFWGIRTAFMEAHLVDDTTPLEWEGRGYSFVDAGEVGIAVSRPQYEDEEPDYLFRTDSGLGDGCYPVEVAKNEEGLVVAFRVTFISEENIKEETK